MIYVNEDITNNKSTDVSSASVLPKSNFQVKPKASRKKLLKPEKYLHRILETSLANRFLIKGLNPNIFKHEKDGRGDKIRTCDPLHPMQVRYQAAPLPDLNTKNSIAKRKLTISSCFHVLSVECFCSHYSVS